MLIALVFAWILAFAFLVLFLFADADARFWRRLAKDASAANHEQIKDLKARLEAAEKEAAALRFELAMAEVELEEALDADDDLADENEDVLAAIADYMARVESATEDLGDALAVATGSGEVCRDCCCNGTH